MRRQAWHTGTVRYVLAAFLLLVVMMLSLFSSEASGCKDLCQQIPAHEPY